MQEPLNTTMQRICILVMLASLGPPAARAGDLDLEGEAAFLRGDYATALRQYEPLAEQGNTDAQFHLGVMYADGRGIPQDDVEAARWFRMAAENENSQAQVHLAAMYEVGRGVPQDDAEAAKWYRPAAAGGAPRAQYNLGLMYMQGRGVTQDYTLAYVLFDLAKSSLDRQKDRNEAARNRDLVGSRMTSAQIAKARRLECGWDYEVIDENFPEPCGADQLYEDADGIP